MKKNICRIFIMFFAMSFLYVANSFALNLGQDVSTVNILDGNDNPKDIPFIGSKVITLMYTDPDVKDVNDTLSNAIKAKNYPKAKYQGIGVVNCKDTWIPNAAIRKAARDKEKQFAGSIILVDDKYKLKKAWNLGDCDDAGVVIIIGADKKIKYVKTIKTKAQSAAAINEVLAVLDKEIK